MGECYLTCSAGGKYTCWPSEGGHAEFAPRDEITYDLLEALKAKFSTTAQAVDLASARGFALGGIRPKRVSVERVVSGPGLSNIYDFLRAHWAIRLA